MTLKAAGERLQQATKALAPKHKGGEVEEYRAALEALCKAERDLAAFTGCQYAVPFEMPLWDTGAPLPHLLQNDNSTILIYLLSVSDEHANITTDLVQSLVGPPERVAVITFEGCICTKMGTPNDEVFQGHPLYGKGFVPYSAMTVQNSDWIRELEAINSTHHGYRPGA